MIASLLAFLRSPKKSPQSELVDYIMEGDGQLFSVTE